MTEERKLKDMQFKVALKKFQTEGNLVYEYNPFRNYRLDLDMWYYRKEFYTSEELAKLLGFEEGWSALQEAIRNNTSEEDTSYDWYKVIPRYETIPVLYQKGLLVDLVTDLLQFDLKHPVNILPTYSYDNSVDLIINDGITLPKIINSRFSATERNKYKINDRRGNNDTNIYDKGIKFESQTSLYRNYSSIANFELLSVGGGGNLKVGLYSLYFTYLDDDGNESDIFLESGPIEIFIGFTAFSINSGFRDENSYKTISYVLENLDRSYNRLQIYYTRATSDIYENPSVIAYKLIVPVTYVNLLANLSLTGFEDSIQIPIEDINKRLLRYVSAETLEVCLNRLFLGHTYKIPLNYRDLRDIALRFYPILNSDKKYEALSSTYSGDISNTYYDPKFAYLYTGYWNDYYRFGIVFILSDGTYSDVYDVRGCVDLKGDTTYTDIGFYEDDDKTRKYIAWDETSYEIITDNSTGPDGTKSSTALHENARGVVKFSNSELYTIVGIKFRVSKKVLDYLENVLLVKGFFFVRKKRIPTILCQAYTIPIDKESNTPVLPYGGELINATAGTSDNSTIDPAAYTESFLEQSTGKIVHGYLSRLITISSEHVRNLAAICPEYDINFPYYNSIFCGTEIPIRPYTGVSISSSRPTSNIYNAVILGTPKLEDGFTTASVIGVEDNVALVETAGYKFSARAGEAEEANKYKYVGLENKSENAVNLIRGSYGPYLGIVGYETPGKLINLYIPGYSEFQVDNYLKVRYLDNAAYYSISKLFDILNRDIDFNLVDEDKGEYELSSPLYRGDCFICNFTHRLNRNFQDPSAPTNDEIVNPSCWKDNYKVEDDVVKAESFGKINLGDLNAVKLGTYINMVVKSSINLNIRAKDDSVVDEVSLTGSSRLFVPNVLYPVDGVYKKPEALCYNSGLSKTTNERIYVGLPDVPFFMEDYTNRIAYSDIKIKDSFANGFRVFEDGNYRDYPKTYGSIIKLIETDGSLICVLEHGIYRIPVNERAVAAEGSGGLAYINTLNILPENPEVLSDKFGSQWRDSVIRTPLGIYGVDTVGKKIWRVTGDSFKSISDFKILKFLNDNISLTERELIPIIGVRNVKTHYNAFKGDVMFTFYDNLTGFEERVWNICYNERLDLWTTFYSWVPSASENIYNQYFSFDRNTSKWIAKLGISSHGSSFADGVTLDNNVIPTNIEESYIVSDPDDDRNNIEVYWEGKLYLDNRVLTSITRENSTTFSYATFKLVRDNYGNYKNFRISKEIFGIDKNGVEVEITDVNNILTCEEVYQKLLLIVDPSELCSEFYERVTLDETYPLGKDGKNLSGWDNRNEKWEEQTLTDWKASTKDKSWSVYKNEQGKRVWLDYSKQINGNRIVTLLNIRAHINIASSGSIPDVEEALTSGYANLTFSDGGYYESVVALCTDYNRLFLSTDFWKHGRAGTIDIADKIYPTYWYGKQHPFEFEFIVRDTPDVHKIFDNLEIISNKAEPESFHYEIVGECYEFAKDKKNMYIRQEATKEMYQYNGSDIVFDSDYKDLEAEPRNIKGYNNFYDKSTIFPLYYARKDTINEIEDYYHLYGDKEAYAKNDPNYSSYAGAEIVRYEDLDEYRIWNHSKAVDISKEGNLRGNMVYKEDKWRVQINPLNFVLKNELKSDWVDGIPIVYNLFPLPEDISDLTLLNIPNSNRTVYTWDNITTQNKEAKLKDKFMKIRIRYSGKNLAIISAVKTLYSISYA